MKPLKILFADDDLKYSMLLKRFLEKEGYEVTYAGNGLIALDQFPLVKPDLVLLDINMPGLNGFEVAKRIREADKHVLIFIKIFPIWRASSFFFPTAATRLTACKDSN